METVNARYYNGNALIWTEIKIETSRICTHCQNTGKQLLLSANLNQGSNDTYDGICITICEYCSNTSVHYLESVYNNNLDRISHYEPISSYPKQINSTDFSEQIQNSFPEFIKIFDQSQKAEDNDLDQLAGMGYRKAVEFLVTDYLKMFLPEGTTVEWLEDPKTSLSQKINKIPNERIVKISTAISYLGNDQTHYTPRHPEYDIQSIKTFIKALIGLIDLELTTQEAEKEADILLNKK